MSQRFGVEMFDDPSNDNTTGIDHHWYVLGSCNNNELLSLEFGDMSGRRYLRPGDGIGPYCPRCVMRFLLEKTIKLRFRVSFKI